MNKDDIRKALVEDAISYSKLKKKLSVESTKANEEYYTILTSMIESGEIEPVFPEQEYGSIKYRLKKVTGGEMVV